MFCKAKSRGNFRPLPNKNVQMLDPFFTLFFPKDSESLKILDIRLREVGAKRPLNGTSKVNRQTNTPTDRQTDISTYRKHRPRGPMLWKWIQSGITPRFQGSMSWSTNTPVHQLNTSHAWTFHRCNLEQLLVFKALQIGQRLHQSTSQTPPTCGRFMYAIQIIGLYELVDKCPSPPPT